MNLIENKTKFTHLNMPSWGVGVYRKSDGDYITVEFENAGIKKLSKATINSMLIPVGGTIETTPTPAPKKQSATKNTYAPVNDHNGSLIQYDGEASCIAGKNVIEAFEGNDSIIFNETYMIVGVESSSDSEIETMKKLKKLFKKNVPFSRRSYVAALLIKNATNGYKGNKFRNNDNQKFNRNEKNERFNNSNNRNNSIAANKVKGIRAALCGDCFSAQATREHNDANILALGARVTGPGLAVKIVDTFLHTDFSVVQGAMSLLRTNFPLCLSFVPKIYSSASSLSTVQERKSAIDSRNSSQIFEQFLSDAYGSSVFVGLQQNKNFTFDQKLYVAASGAGDMNIITMCLIYLLAGIFSALATEAGGVYHEVRA